LFILDWQSITIDLYCKYRCNFSRFK